MDQAGPFANGLTDGARATAWAGTFSRDQGGRLLEEAFGQLLLLLLGEEVAAQSKRQPKRTHQFQGKPMGSDLYL